MTSQFQKMLQKPSTIALTTRIDARTLAALDSYWKSHGEFPRSTSELARVCLEFLAEVLQYKQLAPFFATQEEAIKYLDKTSLKFKIQRKFMHERLLQEDSVDVSEEIMRRFESSEKKGTPDLSFPTTHPSVQEAAEILEQQMKEESKE
jgi:hypothetical protein